MITIEFGSRIITLNCNPNPIILCGIKYFKIPCPHCTSNHRVISKCLVCDNNKYFIRQLHPTKPNYFIF